MRARTDQTTAIQDDREASGFVFVCVCESGTFTKPLDPSRAMIFGRGEECDVVLDDPSVSRKHAAIGGEPLKAEDLGSRNGSRLFGARLAPGAPVLVPVGASIELGRAVVLVQRGAPASAGPEDLPPSFIAADPRTQRVVRLAEVIATRPGNVLIVGEPGSGKETLARFVHARSNGAAGPFVRFEDGVRATGGTLFVDGLDKLPLPTQRALATSTDARIVSSAGPDAAQTIVPEVLRSLASVILTVPPLRERVADIEPLARMFARGRAQLTRGAIARLEAHTWPTNLTGLASAIEAAVLGSDGVVDEDALATLGVAATKGGLHEAVEDLERRRVLDALAAAGGNQSVAARKLGIARGTLIARLAAYGVARPRKKT